jgi:hypothetical protein
MNSKIIFFQVATFEVNKKNAKPKLDVIHSFHTHSSGQIHFMCIHKTEAAPKSTKNANKLDNLLDSLTILYCDNTGVMKRILNTSSSSKDHEDSTSGEYSTLHADMDLDESMRLNRKLLAKNLPQSNLSAILDMQKSSKYFDESKLVAENRNEILELNLNKVIKILFFFV